LEKKVIKVSTPWNGGRFIKQANPEILSRYSFEIDNDCDKSDFWIVWGDFPDGIEKMKVTCPPEHIFYMTDEAYVDKKFNQQFLNQFPGVITCRKDIDHKNLIATHEINVYQLDKPYSLFNHSNPIPKTKKLSVVCSDKTFLIGHKKRFAFVNKLVGHFKDRIDALGSGFTPINDKWEALHPYEYSIAIENSALPGYFTEKIGECYLGHSFPIYFGAPDIDQYFDSKSYMLIDIEDYIGSIRKIEQLLEENSWAASEPLLIQQKMKYINEYHFFPALAKVLERVGVPGAKSKKNAIRSHRSFDKYFKARKLLQGARKLLPV
jgi:hypothetical protein